MNRKFVSSSNLKSVGYEAGILEIEFRDGSVYQYFGVPNSIYQRLMSASSKGSYFARFIKNKYHHQKL